MPEIMKLLLCEHDLEEEEDEVNQKLRGNFHSHALEILSNSLKLSAHCGNLSKVLEKFGWLSMTFFLFNWKR